MNIITAQKTRKKRSQAGFTLVEIAIVLVIIGLLMGGIIKGQSMIQSAKVKRLVADIEGLRAAAFTYQDKYGMLPGDENDKNSPPGDKNNGNNNGRLNEKDGYEIEDLRLAEIISGSGVTLPKNPFGGTLRIDWIKLAGGTNNFIVATNVPGEIAQEIDTKYDDGLYNKGDIQGNAKYVKGNILKNFGWKL